MAKIDFSSFELAKGHVLIEFPTKTDGGLILSVGDNSTTQSGWFKIVKSGKKNNWEERDQLIIDNCENGVEGFIYFHHPPYMMEEIIFKSRAEQLDSVKEHKAKKEIVISDGKGGLKTAADMEDDGRIFAMVREHDLLMTRARK